MTVAFKRATLSDLAYLFSFKVCCYLYKVKTFIPLNTESQHIFKKKATTWIGLLTDQIVIIIFF